MDGLVSSVKYELFHPALVLVQAGKPPPKSNNPNIHQRLPAAAVIRLHPARPHRTGIPPIVRWLVGLIARSRLGQTMLGYRAIILLFFISSLLLVARPAEPAFVAGHRDAQNIRFADQWDHVGSVLTYAGGGKIALDGSYKQQHPLLALHRCRDSEQA
jgi:hypothetical protein